MTKENIIRMEFIAEGTTCNSCAEIIKRQAHKVHGVKEVEFDYASEKGYVIFDKHNTNIDKILYKIEEKGYTCYILDEPNDSNKPNHTNHANSINNNGNTQAYSKNKDQLTKTIGWVFGIIGIIVIGYFILKLVDGINMPQISQNMGYGLLFFVGLLTGFHCISMCGGFVVSYTAKDAQEGKKSHKSHLMYGIGKTLSYTIIGAVFGLVGSIIAFTPIMRGTVGIFAGLFLILFGLKMLNIFPILRKFSFKMPKFIIKSISTSKHSSPLVIGLLNGLMIACGPLQAIYIMAAGTGSMIEGAKLLFVFALGTLPVMLGFGFLTSFLSNKMTHKILKASGAIVIILGLVMLNNGLVLTGSGYDLGSMVDYVGGGSNLLNLNSNSGSSENSVSGSDVLEGVAVLKDGYQEIRMEVNRYGWTPDKFILKKDVSVKWIINGKEITSCNNAIQVPKLGLEFKIKQGEQIIDFIPTEEGIIKWSCWMGMIPGTFLVKEELNLNSIDELHNELNSVPVQAGGNCGGNCGGSCGVAKGRSCGCSGGV
ncbi:MAG: sulfite exporter TauE/SafE family protein [Candidatus Woesearchaeota archaeon]